MTMQERGEPQTVGVAAATLKERAEGANSDAILSLSSIG
ncbi:MAG: hypothetical protein KEFWMYNX_000789 [Candidatus Fervidibacter sp.]